MTSEQWALIGALAIGAFAVRIAGLAFGVAVMGAPRLKAMLDDLPGCLIVALVAASLADGGLDGRLAVWASAAVALAMAVASNNVLATMAAGVGALLMLQGLGL